MSIPTLNVGDRVRNAKTATMFANRVGTITIGEDDPRFATARIPMVGVLFDGMEQDHAPLGVTIAVETLTKLTPLPSPQPVKLTDFFDDPNPPGTHRRLMADDPRRKSHDERKQMNQRRSQGAKAQCKR